MSNKSVVSEIVNSQNGFFGGRAEGQITGVKALTIADLEKMWVCTGTTADYSVYLPKPSECAGKMVGLRMDPGLTKLVTLDAGQTDNVKTGTVQVWSGQRLTLYPNSGWTMQFPSCPYTGTNWKQRDSLNYAAVRVGDRINWNDYMQSYPNDAVTEFSRYVATIDTSAWSTFTQSFTWNQHNGYGGTVTQGNGVDNDLNAGNVDQTGIVGTNTTFLTDLAVGGLMWVSGVSRTVAAIIDDTHCAVTVPFPTAGSGLTYSTSGAPYTIDGEQKRIMWANEVAILYSDGYKWTKIAGKSIPMSAGIAMNANQTFANTTVTKMLFDASFGDLRGPTALQEISSSQLRILRSGLYSVRAQFQWYWAAAPATTVNVWVKRNGSTIVAQGGLSTSGGNAGVPEAANPSVILTAGDYLTGHAAYYSGSLSPTIYGNTANYMGPATFMLMVEVPTW